MAYRQGQHHMLCQCSARWMHQIAHQHQQQSRAIARPSVISRPATYTPSGLFIS
jgi:hypothetical protein